MNFTAQNMLLLKIDSMILTEPLQIHVLIREIETAWSFNSSNNRFQCSAHNNSYATDCSTAGTAGGTLKCYSTSLSGSTLKVTV